MSNQARPEQSFYAKLITESSLFRNIFFMGSEPSFFLLNTIIIPYASLQTTVLRTMPTYFILFFFVKNFLASQFLMIK